MHLGVEARGWHQVFSSMAVHLIFLNPCVFTCVYAQACTCVGACVALCQWATCGVSMALVPCGSQALDSSGLLEETFTRHTMFLGLFAIILCVWVFCLHVSPCTVHSMPDALEGQKVSEPLQLELETVVSFRVCVCMLGLKLRFSPRQGDALTR